MHELTHRAALVVARHLDRVVESVQPDQSVAAEALAGRRAASDRLALSQEIVLHRVVEDGTTAVLQQHGVTVRVTSRCHRLSNRRQNVPLL